MDSLKLCKYFASDSINLKKFSTFICKWKINFIFQVFLKILQRYYEVIILGTLGVPGYTHPK